MSIANRLLNDKSQRTHPNADDINSFRLEVEMDLFFKRLRDEQIDIPADIGAKLNEHFWDLLHGDGPSGSASGIVGEVPSSGPERSVEPDSPTAVIRRDAQEQPTEGKHPSSVKGIGVEEIMKVVDPLVIWDGTEIGPDGGDAEAECRARLTALLSPDQPH